MRDINDWAVSYPLTNMRDINGWVVSLQGVAVMFLKKFLAVTAALVSVTFCMGITAFADDIDDNELEAEEVSIEDEIRAGEGYYECHIVYHGGVPEIYDEDGVQYDLVGTIGGYVQEGETRESIEKDAAENIRQNIAATGADPDDYGFEVYVYFYDDYDLTPTEFLNFISEDIAKRESERLAPPEQAVQTEQVEEVPNPVTGNGFPYAVCGTVFCAVGALYCLHVKIR